MSVKIAALEAENVKRIKAVALTPSPTGLTIVGGNNNQGKTSVLDALAWALGGEKFRPTAAVRDGALAPPHLKVILSNGVVVERKGKNSSLTVTDPTGQRSGQQLLNAFVEPLALDLPRFMQASDKDKADTLLNIIGVGDALTGLDREIKALYDRRTVIGQIGAQKRHAAEELTEYPDAPSEPVSAIELIQQQQEILLHNADNQRKRMKLAQLEEQEKQLGRRVQELSQELEMVEHQLTAVQQDVQDATKTVAQLQDESTAELEQSIRNVEEINRQVSANLAKSKAQDEAERYAQEYTALTEQIKAKRTARMDLLNGADLPLTGLGVEDGSLTYNGKHWQDMSGSDQLRVATAIVRRLNPDCGFVLLDKLEQMDLATLAEFGSWLQTEGLQAIATRVSTGGECQIIIEDGRIKDAEEPPAPKAWTKGAF
ncbi:AAA family ATPase [Gemmiger sp.]|uniref:ATP-binding protein n=1 Tax=Gemmiger sp. TaxID=2049027 RepID=UPI0025C627D1|nr:AAA family ATPase [Gemmiger sp.]